MDGVAVTVRGFGGVGVDDPDSRVGVTGRRQQRLLALLVIRLGKVANLDWLAEFLWDDAERPKASTTRLRTYLSRLRHGFFETMLAGRDGPEEVTMDLAAPLLRVIAELLPGVLHDTTQYANNCIEWDHGRLEARLTPMHGLRTDRTASTVIRGHTFVQNLRSRHYELGADTRHEGLRVAAGFDELTAAV